MDIQQKDVNSQTKIVLVVPKQLVKFVKSALERSGHLDRTSKITQETKRKSRSDVGELEQRMRIPITVPYAADESGLDNTQDSISLKMEVLDELGLTQLHQDVSISHHTRCEEQVRHINKNPLLQALQTALEALPESVLDCVQLATENLISSFPESYSVYKPMLLLSQNAFAAKPWKELLAHHTADSQTLGSVWESVAQAVGATHAAINSPIPLQTNANAEENILRSPVNLIPIYGNFGPSPTTQTLSAPAQSDFDNALWVSTTQNGIHQTWAPLYTMFSRGNIREKTRILQIAALTKTSFPIDRNDKPSTVVDMYAGIGYFAFSYKKGSNHIKPVLCFELNPWSVEGLRRGAVMNNWTSRIFKEEDLPTTSNGWDAWRRPIVNPEPQFREDFWIFHMSNEHALPTISEQLEGLIPPINHINLGLLPTSRLSWRSAVCLIDGEHGGWLHAHENVGVKQIDERTKEIEKTFQKLLNEYDDENDCPRRRAKVEHVERVKMYAPGVMHCVFDVRIGGEKERLPSWQ